MAMWDGTTAPMSTPVRRVLFWPTPKPTRCSTAASKIILGNPLVGIDVNANDSSNLFSADGYTDATGTTSLACWVAWAATIHGR